MSGIQPGFPYSSCYYSDPYPTPSAPSLSPNDFLEWGHLIQLPSESPYPSYSYDPESSQAESQSHYQDPQFPPYQSYYNPSSFAPEQQFSAHPHLQQPAYCPHDPYAPSLGNSSHPMHNPSSNPLFSLTNESGFDSGRSDVYENKPQIGFSDADDGFNQGSYRYDGGKVEPYGAWGIEGPSKSNASWLGFDDYESTISFSAAAKDGESGKQIIRAMPKADAQQDVNNGVQKFRVKLLPEESGSIIDVICQIGMDGIRLLDPSTSRTLRIYPLLTVTRGGTIDSIFCFYAKTSVDTEPRRVRLQSNQYTTKTIFDAAIAAMLQVKEMQLGLSHRSGATDDKKQSTQPPEEKKGLIDWMKQKMPANEEKHHWVPDEAIHKCECGVLFHALLRKHHCRNCGAIFCDKCTLGRIALTADQNAQPVRVCDRCLAEVFQTMSHAEKGATKPASLQSHEDLVQKLQEAMDINRKTSTGSESDESMQQMNEVACPTCTVLLEVQLSFSGSQIIECGVCQHPFILTAP